jgi:hypothetical protein
VPEHVIRATEVKSLLGSDITERIARAAAEGARFLTVVNKGRPVAYLALAEDMDPEWRVTEPATVPLSELRQGAVSISGLRREGRALYLSQRSGPTLALWPVEGTYSRPADLTPQEELEQLRRDLNKLRHEVERLRRRDKAIGALVKLAVKLFVETEPAEDA